MNACKIEKERQEGGLDNKENKNTAKRTEHTGENKRKEHLESV